MSSDSTSSVGAVVGAKQHRGGARIELMTPLFYAPLLPLTRIALRKQHKIRPFVYAGVVAAAFCHGTYMLLKLPGTSDPHPKQTGGPPGLKLE
eukprot:m.20973 g.20973  ORF g.20973 m.20973 type:complete len:93 (+) comp8652_c0_seq2:167-445(+)